MVSWLAWTDYLRVNLKLRTWKCTAFTGNTDFILVWMERNVGVVNGTDAKTEASYCAFKHDFNW